MKDHTFRPDIFTASDDYARRFSGSLGEFFLRTQSQHFFSLLIKDKFPLDVLEIGGGHGQLTEQLLRLGHRVSVHGSDPTCFSRIKTLLRTYKDSLSFIEVPIENLELLNNSYDVVTALRLFAHTSNWRSLLIKMAAATKYQVIFDIAPSESLNLFTPLFFHLKKAIEKNTRKYYRHSRSEVFAFLSALNFSNIAIENEFFFPMALHRAVNNASISAFTEKVARGLCLTKHFGSPCLVSAWR